jgi:hypothetical protein
MTKRISENQILRQVGDLHLIVSGLNVTAFTRLEGDWFAVEKY